MKKSHPQKARLVLVLVLGFIQLTGQLNQAFAQDAKSKDHQIAQLEKRLSTLEARSKHFLKLRAPETILEKNQIAALKRAERDSANFSQEKMREIEIQYRKAYRGTLEDLENFVATHQNHNRTGCALLTLGQRAEKNDQEAYLKEAIEKYDDAYFGDGMQVGPYARFNLAHLYAARGKQEESRNLFSEIVEAYPDAISPNKKLLSTMIEDLEKRPKVVSANPDHGDRTVSPDLEEIKIVFDRPMSPGGHSFVGGGSSFPKVTGKPRWLDEKTIILPVELRHSHEYSLSINSNRFKNFRSKEGHQAVSYPIKFKTSSAP